jgi:hypothetical protein
MIPEPPAWLLHGAVTAFAIGTASFLLASLL